MLDDDDSEVDAAIEALARFLPRAFAEPQTQTNSIDI